MADDRPGVPLDEPGAPDLDTFECSDGYRCYYRHYRPRGPYRGRVLCLHGVQSHGGWYGQTSADLAAAGFEVFFLDRRGSGLNTARRGDAPSFRRLLDDIAEFVHALPALSASPADDRPPALVAVSWGGKLGVALQYRAPGAVSRLALLCPGLAAKVSPPLSDRVRIARTRWRDPTRRFPLPLSDPELFTSSPTWQVTIARDRYALRDATGRFLVESVSLDLYLKRAWRHVKVPTLLALASEDRVIDNALVRAYAERFPGGCEVEEYRGAHHTLEFEQGRPHVGRLVGWLGEDGKRD